MDQLKEKQKFLKAISGLSQKDRAKYLEECPECFIHDICEAVNNLLINVCPPTKPSGKRKVVALKKHLKKLCHAKTSASQKRKLLSSPQIGKGVFSLIGTTVVPFLIDLLTKK